MKLGTSFMDGALCCDVGVKQFFTRIDPLPFSHGLVLIMHIFLQTDWKLHHSYDSLEPHVIR